MKKTLQLILALALLIAPAFSQTTPERPKVRFAFGGHILHFLPLDLAIARDLFAEQGLDAEVVQLQSGTPTAQALLAGEVDFSTNAIDHVFKAAAQGKDTLRMVMLLGRLPGMSLVIDSRLKDEIKTLADLKGRSLGVTSRGSATHMVLASLLLRAGIRIEDVTIVEVKPAAMAAALENRQIVGGIALEPFATLFEEQGKTVRLADLATPEDSTRYLGGVYNQAGLLTRQDVLDQRPEVVRKAAAALQAALRLLQERTPEEIANMLPADVTGPNKAQYVRSLTKFRPYFSPDGVIPPEGVVNVFESMKHAGALPAGTQLDVTRFYLTPEQLRTLGSQPAASRLPGTHGRGIAWYWWVAVVALLAIVWLLMRRPVAH